MEPLPTPYDIKEIPRFPFEPSRSTWIALLAGCALLVTFALMTRWLSQRRQSSEKAAVQLRARLASIQARLPGSNTRLASEETSSLVRRYLAIQFGEHIPALSQAELEAWKTRSGPAWEPLFGSAVALEDLKYSPQSPSESALGTIIRNVQAALDTIVEAA